MTPRPASFALVALLTLGACGDDRDSAGPHTAVAAPAAATVAIAPARVTIARSRFSDVELRVAVGTTVVFENTDPFAHTITSNDSAPVEFDSGELGLDETFEFTFDEPGEYPYFCRIHPTMRAVVIVG
jgi:plastocyanin